MSVSLEYHEVVNVSEADSWQRFIPFSLALLGICLFSLLPSISNAQIGGVSPGAIHSVPVAPPTAVQSAASNCNVRAASNRRSTRARLLCTVRTSHWHFTSASSAAKQRKSSAP